MHAFALLPPEKGCLQSMMEVSKLDFSEISERICRSAAEGLKVREIVGCSESHNSGGEIVGGTADSYSAQEGIRGSAKSFTIPEKTGETPADGNKIPERIGAGSDKNSAGKVQEKGKEEKLHSREEGLHQRQSESSEERRLRARVESSSAGAAYAGVDEPDEPKALRPARPSGGKDRHSKVNTAKGPRDRRVRLSVPTAVQFYDVQDRLGFDQPSKAVEWLIHKAKDAIDELGRIPVDGNEGTRLQGVSVSDFSHHGPTPSSYSAAVSAINESGTSSCPPASSFQALSSNPYGDQLSFFMDPSISTPGMFAPLQQPNQGNYAGPTFGLGRIDLTRLNSGSIDGGRSCESTGSPLARVESRTKARERARERTKKVPGRDVTGGGSPSSSSQSPPFHVNPTFGISSFSSSSSMEGSVVHSLSLQSPHQTPLLAGMYEGTPFSRLVQDSHQAVPFQNLSMHSGSLDSQFDDQIQRTLQNAFLVQPQASAALHSPSQSTMNLLQRPQLQIMQVNAQGVLQLGSTFNTGPSSSSFDEASTSSSHYTSVPHLSVGGMSPASCIAPHQPTGSPTPIPPGFSPGPPASAFRAHSLLINHDCSVNQNQQQQLQGFSRVQRPVPSFSAAPSISTLQPGSSSSRASTLMGCLQSTASEKLNSPSFAPRTNTVGYEQGQRPRSMMSPTRRNSFQASNSQIPARIQGLDDMEEVEEELNPATPSSPHP